LIRGEGRKFLEGASPLLIPSLKASYQRVQEGLAPLFSILPLSFEGEGDKGGEVDIPIISLKLGFAPKDML